MFNFLKMPQFNRKYPSGAEKNKEKVRKHKVDEKCKGLLDRFVIVASGTGQRRVHVHTQVVSSSYVCLVHNQMCHTQNSSFVKMRLINTCFRSFIFL